MNVGVKPFIILSKKGDVLSLLQTNEKGYKKSIENSQIWAVDPETGRLLPDEQLGRAEGFNEKPGWYQAVSSAGNVDTSRPSGEKVSAAAETDGAADSSVIERLYKIILKRKQDLPEGSYTTHLFNSGPMKIKKKTGEEAVELLLAENREETIYEAADLIYHMLVLLAAEDIAPEEIFKELVSRE